ncbi:MAG: indolepyruvate oxidoreductase subunit beta [Chloroflexi bacterium]|nr:indolepyruvate oxidoreductase subunit beta [Chloroflexota bacterium]
MVGLGTILASDVLVNIGLEAGFQAKQAEVHGMSQRGGSVTSHVRWGKVVYSPLIGAGEADVLLAFEKLEALRSLNAMRPGALVLVNMQVIQPLTAISGEQTYPGDEALHKLFAKLTSHIEYINGEEISGTLGNLKVANVVLMGALSALLERSGQAGAELTPELWLKVITERVPAKHVELNHKAFQAGREAVGTR